MVAIHCDNCGNTWNSTARNNTVTCSQCHARITITTRTKTTRTTRRNTPFYNPLSLRTWGGFTNEDEGLLTSWGGF